MTLVTQLPKVRGEYRENYPLSPLTWFKVGGAAEVLFKPYDLEDLANFLAHLPADIPLTILGAGSNVIVRSGGIEGVVIRLGRSFTQIEALPDNHISIGAGALNYNIAQVAMEKGLSGLEFLVGIPGTAGGGIAMNAGAYGREYKDIVVYVEALDRKGALHTIYNKDIGFEYRRNNLSEGLIYTKMVCRATAGSPSSIKELMDDIMQKRESSQPVREKTGGSTFANPEGYKAWQLIDKVGMRGAREGDAMISELHCNFMINCGNATAEDLEILGEKARSRVKSECGVELKWEIKRLGKKPAA